MDLSNVSTAELVRELSNREGVEKIVVEPYQPYQIIVGETHVSDSGPIVLLRVWTDKRRVRRGNRQFIEAPKTAASHHFGDLRCLCPHSDPKSVLKFSVNHRDNGHMRRLQFMQSYEIYSKSPILACIILYNQVLL